MERSAGTNGGELPAFEAELDGPVDRPSGSGPARRRPGGARSAGIAVAALVLLTAGVALGGVLDQPSPTTAPFACVPVSTDSVPSFALGVVGQDGRDDGRRGWGIPGAGWNVPGTWRSSTLASGSVLELRTKRGACVRYVTAEYADASLDREPRAAERRNLIDAAVEPASQNPGLGILPDGDWVLRAVASFETGVSGSGGLVIAEFYFRLQVGPGPLGSPMPVPTPEPEPTPAVTPAVACGPAPSSGADVSLLLSASGTDAVVGVPEGGAPGVVSVDPGDEAEIAVEGAACATSWSFTISSVLGTERGEPDRIGELDNPTDDPRYAAQNRWRVSVPLGTFDLVARLHLGPGVEVVRLWRLVGREFTVPEAVVFAGDGSRVLALPGCGITLQLANGYSAGDSCGSIGYPAGLEALHVPAWSVVTFEIPGWSIASWYGSCGRIDVDGSGLEYFNPVNGCFLGGYSVTDGAEPPGPARFLARPGEQVVQLYVTASRDGDTFQVPMFAVVTGE